MDLVDIDKVLDDLELSSALSSNSTSNMITTVANQLQQQLSNSISVDSSTCYNTANNKNDFNYSSDIASSLYHHAQQQEQQQIILNQHLNQNINKNISDQYDSLTPNIIIPVTDVIPTISEIKVATSILSAQNTDKATTSSNTTALTFDDDRYKTKKVVTVSNVFSSLKDYLRDVESLQHRQQLQEDSSNLVKQQQQHSNDNSNDDYEKDYDVEKQSEDMCENVEGGTVSVTSSITTSSTSSFSSGPSPGSASISSDSFALQQKQELQQNSKFEPNNEINTNRKEVIQNCDVRIKQSTKEFIAEKLMHNKENQLQNSQHEENREISEVGLSSISSSYLYCENVSSSLPCSSQDMKFDVFSSISSSHMKNMMMLNSNRIDAVEASAAIDNDKNQQLSDDDENSLAPLPQQQQQQNKQKAIGFGSTMDEISDTELDSILQEIDNEFQMYYTPATGTNGSNDDHIVPTAVPEKSATPSSITTIATTTTTNNQQSKPSKRMSNSSQFDENKQLEDKKKSITGFVMSSQEVLHTPQFQSISVVAATAIDDDDNNLQNADSFSQASTIEFADLRLQQDFDVDINECSTATDFESEKSSLVTNSNTQSDQIVAHQILSLQNSDDEMNLKKAHSKELSVVETAAATTATVTSNDASNLKKSTVSQQLQRPNSLDLPSKQMDLKMYINSTAGQTPPASRLDDISLLSTSSSEDQQLSSSEQFDGGAVGATSSNNNNNNGAQQQQQLNSLVSISSSTSSGSSLTVAISNRQHLGKIQPFWIPDSDAPACMQCKQKFSLIKRRHHCRACGLVLCSTCCSQKAKLAFLNNSEARVCNQCSIILNVTKLNDSSNLDDDHHSANRSESGCKNSVSGGSGTQQLHRSPNPNNPMEYCSTISPYQQVGQQVHTPPISVMVPVGVLKREGAPKNPRKDKTVIFSDGIRPGCDLTDLDNSWGQTSTTTSTTTTITTSSKKTIPSTVTQSTMSVTTLTSGIVETAAIVTTTNKHVKKLDISNNNNNELSKTSGSFGNSSEGNLNQNKQQGNKLLPISSEKINQRNSNKNFNLSSTSLIYDENGSYIPKEANNLPPICISNKTDVEFKEIQNNLQLIERLQNETLKFAVQRNFFIYVKIVKLKCCVNKVIINFTTQGMHHVGQDEIIILLELDNSNKIPKDIFIHLNEIYKDADHGYPITELGFSMPKEQQFLESKEHGGFLYIRPSFQCLQEIQLPESPFLIGILIHRWEVPWAKIFPLRLMLRLGAEYRYYPSPHISIRGRNSVYAEIAQTIINFLADFRNYSYTIATIKGMFVHMEDRRTNILIPKNRYDQVVKALNNSSDHILALAANFSKKADGHLVCIQNMEADCPETYTYSTQAINIQGQARKVTGASFIVFNGALKSTSGLTGKCNIVEDGLMVQILPAKMQAVRNSLKNMKDIDIVCGPNDCEESQTEIVSIKWVENDSEFNIEVKSPIDGKKMDGIPSIRVHSGLNYSNKNHIIRWTEVFIIQCDEDSTRNKDPIDISKISEQIAKSTSIALSSYLDLLATNGNLKIGLRATLHQESVCYEAGSKNSKLPPLYMNALDNELIPILHNQAISLDIETPIILELVFHILNK